MQERRDRCSASTIDSAYEAIRKNFETIETGEASIFESDTSAVNYLRAVLNGFDKSEEAGGDDYSVKVGNGKMLLLWMKMMDRYYRSCCERIIFMVEFYSEKIYTAYDKSYEMI